eukprot:TRINITY_DN1474_c0_g2_i2.p1 TRINITY_DN1474_c0_g2~~TRINITY_DN1474_c0_g2_i2.p1  ORF type:complete len:481 (+),score=90.34 TRINITY_DN1474_c0_g2_i2:154-1596(+)
MHKGSIRYVARPNSGLSARSLSVPKPFSGSENVAPPSKLESKVPRYCLKAAAAKVSTPSARIASAPVPSLKKPVSKPFCCGAYCARAAAHENIAAVPKAPPVEKTAQAAQKTAHRGIAQKKEVVPVKEVAPKMDVEPAEVALRSKLVEIDPSAFFAASKDRCSAQSTATPPRVAYPVAQALASLGQCARVHTMMTAPAPDAAAPPAVPVSPLAVFEPWSEYYDVVDTVPLSQVDGRRRRKHIAQKELTDVCRVHPDLSDETDKIEQACRAATETGVKSEVCPALVSIGTAARSTPQQVMPGQRAALQKKPVSMAACAVKPRKQFRFDETVEIVYLPYCEEWQQSREGVPVHTKYDLVHLHPDADMLNAPAVDLLEYLALEAEISAAFYSAAGNYERYNSGRGASVKHLLRHNMNIRQFLLSVVHVAPELTDAAVALFPRYPEAHELYDLPPWQLASNASDSKRFHRECASLNSFSPKFIR